MKRLSIPIALVLLIGHAQPARAQSPQSADALTAWVETVRTHSPGKPDAALERIATLKYSERVTLNSAMRLFLSAVRGEPIATKSVEQRRIMDLFRAAQANPGLAAFLERAAVVHADSAIFRDRFLDFVDDAPTPQPMSFDSTSGLPSSSRNRAPSSPLLINEEAAVHTDGRVVGRSTINWNWVFARSLLDMVLAPPAAEYQAKIGPCRGAECLGTFSKPSRVGTEADRVFIAEWYHATDAYMLAAGRHADLKRQLAHAAEVLPEDARILFDRGCYAETLGLPIYQVLPADPGQAFSSRRIVMNVPSEDKTDAEAEELFRHAIDVDPGYAEARVRLARLLERRGVHDEAASQIEQALSASPASTVAYFGHVIAGRIDQARGRPKESLGHYRAAMAIFPDAQSAMLGASQAAVMTSDVAGALSIVQKLGQRSTTFDADPWWNYHLGAGRDVDDLMAALWLHVPK
jgi:tetratricopeptide (TPR) repeat protein